MNYKNRQSVPSDYKWDLTKWFETDDLWQEKYELVSNNVNCLNKYKGKIFEDNNLYKALLTYYEYENELEKLYAYASLSQDEDLSVGKYEKMLNQIYSVYTKFEENTAYFMPEMLQSNDFNIEQMIKKCPDLKRYKHVLEEIELEKKYTKDEETEKIISNLLSDLQNHSSLASTLLDSDINYGTIIDENGEKVELNTGNAIKYLMSSNRNLRKKVYNKMYDKRIQYSGTLGKNLVSYMTRKSNIAKIRGYNSSMDMHFAPEKLPIKVYENLVRNVEKGLPLFNEYHKMFKKYLGVASLEFYDLSAPITSFEKKYSVEDAKKYFLESVKVIGEDYQEIVKKGFEENWVDFMPYKGKVSGGYCLSIYGVTSNICMNYNYDYDGTSTLAHEMGHAINHYFASKKNNLEDSKHSNYIGEIPSLLNEILLANYVIDGDFSKEEKVSVISHLLQTINSNFFGAVMESEFENIVYKMIDEDEVPSTDELNEVSSELLEKYYGKEVKLNDKHKYMWTRRSHYFMPWYLYKYATCLCGAVYFASKILKGDKECLALYKEFLKAPNNIFPDEMLKKYGIDLENTEIYDEFYLYYENLLDKLKENME